MESRGAKSTPCWAGVLSRTLASMLHAGHWVVGLLRPPPPASRSPFPNFECVQAEYGTRSIRAERFINCSESSEIRNDAKS